MERGIRGGKHGIRARVREKGADKGRFGLERMSEQAAVELPSQTAAWNHVAK